MKPRKITEPMVVTRELNIQCVCNAPGCTGTWSVQCGAEDANAARAGMGKADAAAETFVAPPIDGCVPLVAEFCCLVWQSGSAQGTAVGC